MAWGQLRTSSYLAKLTALLSLVLAALLLTVSSCGPPPKAPPPIRIPSKVVTEEGIEYSVFGLKLPGTSQELKLKEAGPPPGCPSPSCRSSPSPAPRMTGSARRTSSSPPGRSSRGTSSWASSSKAPPIWVTGTRPWGRSGRSAWEQE